MNYIDLAIYLNTSVPCFILPIPYSILLLFRSVKYTPPCLGGFGSCSVSRISQYRWVFGVNVSM